MSVASRQADYGGFDSKFFGPQLVFETGSFERFISLYDDMTSGDRDRAKRRGENIAREDGVRAFHDYALATAIDHENRHFHDFLLSPLSHSVFRLRVYSIFHGLQGLVGVRPGGLLPMPFTQWLEFSDDERDARNADLSSLTGGRSAPVRFTEEDVGVVGLAALGYSEIRRRLEPERLPKLQPIHLFEASAIISQLQSVHALFGDDHGSRFFNLLMGGAAPPVYGWVLSMLRRLWSVKGEDLDLRAMNAMITWAILGGDHTPGSDGFATLRFLSLFEFMTKNGLPNRDHSCAEWFAEWDTVFGPPLVFEMIERSIDADNRLLAQLRAHQHPGDRLLRDVTERLVRGLESLVAGTSDMLGRLRANPDDYVDPNRYINDTRRVAGPTRFDFPEDGVDPRWLDERGFILWKVNTDVDGRQLAVSACLRSPAGSVIDTDIALNTAVTLMLGDLLFSSLSRHDPDYGAARDLIKNAGMVPVEVLPM